ncbi:hypothetical protein [Chamaesiphon sp.]
MNQIGIVFSVVTSSPPTIGTSAAEVAVEYFQPKLRRSIIN